MPSQKKGQRNHFQKEGISIISKNVTVFRNDSPKGRQNLVFNNRGLSVIAVLIFLIFLLALGGGGYYFYKQKQVQTLPPQTTFEYFTLNEDIAVFMFQRIPRLYSRVRQLNSELTMIAAELERIGELENEYPSGKRIVQAERNNWVNLQKRLQVIVQSTEKKIESYYVAYQVNQQTGKELINESLDGLLSQIDDVLETSKKETRRLKVVKEQTFMEKLKDLF